VSDPKPGLPFRLPPPLGAALANAKALYGALSRPARILIGATAAFAILFSGLIAFQKANEAYAPLFSQLDRDDAAAIVAKLKEMKVPYRIEADGATIEVPESKSHELRLELAGGGLPRGGGVGFESFDKMRLGATDFEQRVLYRRALEGELTRTIGTLGAVESARVHLVLPEKSVFVARSEPASASIVLRLHPGRTVGASEVAAVVHLVAAAVPSLEADHIAVVATDGTMLHKPRKSGAMGEAQDGDDDARALAQSYESSVEDRVRAMLEKVVGPGRADVRVTADIDAARVERIEEHYDPSRSALRSEEQSTERSAGDQPGEESLAGVPGAESNLPTGAARGSKADGGAPLASAGAAPGSTRESHTRNFEVDHVSEKRSIAGGALRRLTVAVVLDASKDRHGGAPVSPEEIDKLAMLVRSAAGASEARGDVVTVESMRFAEVDSEPTNPPPSTTALRIQMLKRWGPYAAAAVLGLVLFAGFALRRKAPAALPVADLPASTESAAPAIEAAASPPALDSGDLRTRAHARAVSDPATAALVLRFWLGTSTPDPRTPAKG